MDRLVDFEHWATVLKWSMQATNCAELYRFQRHHGEIHLDGWFLSKISLPADALDIYDKIEIVKQKPQKTNRAENTSKTYENGIKICKKNLPPSYKLPGGPMMDACQCERLLSNGTASIPSVASAVNVRISPRNRLARKWFSRCCGVRNVIWITHVRQKHDDISDE